MRTTDFEPAHESSSNARQANSRRALLAQIARLSVVAAPLALTMLVPVTAAAQEPRRDRRGFPDDQDQPDPRGPNGFPFRGDGQGGPAFLRGMGMLTLVSVGSVNGGTGGGDFGANNPGGDSLSSGSVAVNDGDHHVFVSVRGAAVNAGYNVQFVRLNDHGREDLGSFTTDGNGNFDGDASTSNALGGNHRVGTFVLTRNGQDQYVTSFA